MFKKLRDNSFKTLSVLLISIGICVLVFATKKPLAAEDFGGKRSTVSIGAYTGFVIEPPASVSRQDRRWVWYAPNIDGYPNASCEWLLSRLVAQGFWIGGVDVGEAYGAPYGRAVFNSFYDTMTMKYNLNRKAVLLAQSRGGLMLYNWASEPGNAEKVSRVAGIYPVVDLRSYPGLSIAAPAYRMSAESLAVHLVENNPIDRIKPLVQAGIPIFHIHGDSDKLVPLLENSQVFYDRYIAQGGSMVLKVVPNAGHAELPEFFQDTSLLNFILRDQGNAAGVSRKTSGYRSSLTPGIRNRATRFNLLGQSMRSGEAESHGFVSNLAEVSISLPGQQQRLRE
ncbi:MAG: alpha/beta hydrolase [Fibrobacteres bacterium]|jgi:hypothetical protein|nr:alpha/beta hydrolase [Fibrobacterota bacterium]